MSLSKLADASRRPSGLNDTPQTVSVWPLYLLQQLGTPEAMKSLRHAAESHPDADMRREAKWRSEPLDK